MLFLVQVDINRQSGLGVFVKWLQRTCRGSRERGDKTDGDKLEGETKCELCVLSEVNKNCHLEMFSEIHYV